MTRLLLLAVVMAQALDLATFMAMPRANEVNPLAQGLHSEQAWLAKGLIIGLVVGVDVLVRLSARRSPPRYAWVGVASRNAAQLVAIAALAVGCIGAGSNLAVLSMPVAATTMRITSIL